MSNPLEPEQQSRQRVARVSIPSEYKDNIKDSVEFLNRVKAYLPDNYKAFFSVISGTIVITGEDVSGWTLEDYVIPRLASDLIFAKVVR